MNAKRNMRKGLALWAVAGLTSLLLIVGGRLKAPAETLGRALATPATTSRPVTAAVQPLDDVIEDFDGSHELESWTAPKPTVDESAAQAIDRPPTTEGPAPLETAQAAPARGCIGTLALPALSMAMDENPVPVADDETDLEPSMAGLILN